MYRKILALVLATVIMSSFSLTCLASGVDSQDDIISINGYEVFIIESTKNHQVSLQSKDYANGDVEIVLVEDGQIRSRSRLNRGSSTITYTSYNDDAIKTEVESIESLVDKMVVDPKAVATYTSAGTIKYRWSTSGGTGICGAKVSYSSTTGSKVKYNVNGTYKDVAKLATVIAAGLLLPGVIASPLAIVVVKYFSFAATASNFAIPDHYVYATPTTVKWKTVDTASSSHSGSFSGTSYATTAGGTTKTYTNGNYYPTTAFKNKDKIFAITVYDTLFSYSNWNVESWS